MRIISETTKILMRAMNKAIRKHKRSGVGKITSVNSAVVSAWDAAFESLGKDIERIVKKN